MPNIPIIAGILPGVIRSRIWDQVKYQLISTLDADPDIEAHLKSLPKSHGTASRLTVMNSTMMINGPCYNCGMKGHLMRDCKSLSCGKCRKTWPSESSPGFHRRSNWQQCPAQEYKPQITSYKPATSSKSPYKRLQQVQTTSTTQPVPRRIVDAKIKDNSRTEGFKAALPMMKQGKSIKEMENSVLRKHNRSA